MITHRCASGTQNSPLCYIAFIYTVHMLRAWPLLIVIVALIGQPLIMCAPHKHVFPQTVTLTLLLQCCSTDL